MPWVELVLVVRWPERWDVGGGSSRGSRELKSDNDSGTSRRLGSWVLGLGAPGLPRVIVTPILQ